MKKTSSIAIYPSQLATFKLDASNLARAISTIVPEIRLSAFMRNDYLAISFGYKGHADLVQSAKFRENADRHQPLLWLNDRAIWDNVVTTFVENVSGLKVHHMHLAKNLMLSKHTCSYSQQKNPLHVEHIIPVSGRAIDEWANLLICPEHGSFKQTLVNHCQGNGCPSCSGNEHKTTDEAIQGFIKVHGDRYDYNLVDYINNRTKVKIICPEHGIFEHPHEPL